MHVLLIDQIKIEIETFSENNLPNDLKKIQATKPGSRI